MCSIELKLEIKKKKKAPPSNFHVFYLGEHTHGPHTQWK